MKIVDVLARLQIRQKISGISNIQIAAVVEELMGEFYRSFGDRLVSDPEVIFRFYAAAVNEAKSRVAGVGRKVSSEMIERYLYAQMTRVNLVTGGCSRTTIGAEFGSRKGYVVRAGTGQVVYGEVPYGYVHCRKCGAWYERGTECPFCPKGEQ